MWKQREAAKILKIWHSAHSSDRKTGLWQNATMARRLRHKYGAISCEADAIKFPSKLERRYYEQLKLRKKSGEVVMFLRRPLFDLGGGVTYTADFLEFLSDETVRVIDVKGMPQTDAFRAKKKIVESLYPVEIEVIKKF